MTNAAFFAVRTLMLVLILIHGKLGMLHVPMPGRSVVRVSLAWLDSAGMAVITIGLHDNRDSQRIATEQRQPNGQQHRNNLSE